jgi:hypothetical protein
LPGFVFGIQLRRDLHDDGEHNRGQHDLERRREQLHWGHVYPGDEHERRQQLLGPKQQRRHDRLSG